MHLKDDERRTLILTSKKKKNEEKEKEKKHTIENQIRVPCLLTFCLASHKYNVH